MTTDQKYIDLMNAEIDGEISVEDQALLDAFVANDEAAQALREEFRGLGKTLDEVEMIAPPADLRRTIVDSIQPSGGAARKEGSRLSDLLASLFGVPVVRYGLSFAAGVVLTFTLFSSDQASRQAFDNVTSLVGTMSDTEIRGMVARDNMSLNLNDLAGSVNLSTSGPLMILDFDLTARNPVEIIATFSDRDIWFNGFAQLESQGTTVAAGTGRVTLRMDGQRRYAVYLHNTGLNAATVNIRFVAAGRILHEGNLSFGEND